jgi:hypothetical protein
MRIVKFFPDPDPDPTIRNVQFQIRILSSINFMVTFSKTFIRMSFALQNYFMKQKVKEYGFLYCTVFIAFIYIKKLRLGHF